MSRNQEAGRSVSPARRSIGHGVPASTTENMEPCYLRVEAIESRKRSVEMDLLVPRAARAYERPHI